MTGSYLRVRAIARDLGWVGNTPSFTAHRWNRSDPSSDYPTEGVRCSTFIAAEVAHIGNMGAGSDGIPIDSRPFPRQRRSGG